jgi:hypothetical protein
VDTAKLEKATLIEVALRARPTHRVEFADAPNVIITILEQPRSRMSDAEARRLWSDVRLWCEEIERVRKAV